MADSKSEKPKDYTRYENKPNVLPLAPSIRTIFTDLFHPPFDYQTDPICGKIELNLFKCLEVYGANRGATQCRVYIDDYRECVSFDKQNLRSSVMRDERRRQFKAGERPIKYSIPPRMGSSESTEY